MIAGLDISVDKSSDVPNVETEACPVWLDAAEGGDENESVPGT